MTKFLCHYDFFNFKIENEKIPKDVISLSPDAKYIAYAISKGFIYIYDLDNGMCIQTFDISKDKKLTVINEQHKFTNNIIWHPLEKDIIASCHTNNSVNLWNIKTGKKIGSLKSQFKIGKKWDYNSGFYSISWSPNGKYLACVTKDIIMWDLSTNTISIIDCHNEIIKSLLWSLDGTKLISSINNRSINLWNVSSSKQSENPSILPKFPKLLPLNYKVKPLLDDIDSSISSNTDILNVSLLNTFAKCDYWIYYLSLSRCGKFLASSGSNNIIDIWNITTLEHKSQFKYKDKQHSIISMKFLSDLETIAFCNYNFNNNKICFIDINTGIKKLEINFYSHLPIYLNFSSYDWIFAISKFNEPIYLYNYFGKGSELSSTLLLMLATKNKKSKHTKRLPTELWDWFAFEFLKLF